MGQYGARGALGGADHAELGVKEFARDEAGHHHQEDRRNLEKAGEDGRRARVAEIPARENALYNRLVQAPCADEATG